MDVIAHPTPPTEEAFGLVERVGIIDLYRDIADSVQVRIRVFSHPNSRHWLCEVELRLLLSPDLLRGLAQAAFPNRFLSSSNTRVFVDRCLLPLVLALMW